MNRSRDNLVGIATGYGLDDVGGGGSSSPFRVKKFSLLHIVQTGSEVHPSSYPLGIGGSFRGESGRGVKLTTHLQLVPR
jgi:hypothetical protein